MKKAQEELRAKISKEIEKLKREQDILVFEKAQLWDNRAQLEEAVLDSY